MKSIINTLGLIVLIAFPMIMIAQPASPTPQAVPIDGGASILAAAGIAYGIKKYRDMKKMEQD